MTDPVPMTTIITNITSVVSAAVGWVQQYVTLITGQPLLLLFVITSFVGLGVGLIARLIRL